MLLITQKLNLDVLIPIPVPPLLDRLLNKRPLHLPTINPQAARKVRLVGLHLCGVPQESLIVSSAVHCSDFPTRWRHDIGDDTALLHDNLLEMQDKLMLKEHEVEDAALERPEPEGCYAAVDAGAERDGEEDELSDLEADGPGWDIRVAPL